MTTNNPPIAAWAPSSALAKLASRHNNSPCVLTDGPAELNDVALIRLTDYEALQAECEKMRKAAETSAADANDAERELETIKAKCDALAEALDTALFGTPLDDVPNRDNDDIWSLCYPHLPERASDALRGHLARIETALDAHRKQGGGQ